MFLRYYIYFLLGVFLWIVPSCVFTEKVRDGRTAYDRKQYSVAVQLFSKEYEQTRDNREKAIIAYYLAESYQKVHNNHQSMQWYGQASRLGLGYEATLGLARTLKSEERYEEAILAYRKAGQERGDERAFNGEINMCQIAMEWFKNSDNSDYKIKRLAINSPQNDYSPFPIEGGQLVFTSDRAQSSGSEIYKWTGRKYATLFLANVITNRVELFDQTFISVHNEGNFIVNKDGSKAAFVRCDPSGSPDQYCKIYYLFKDRNIWTEPIEAEFTEEGINYVYPAFSDDGRLLFFSANFPNNQGGFDLYVSEFNNGIWQDPAPLSSRINSVADEISPFIYGDTLYFSSNMESGMGGLDIYMTYLDNQGNWVPPINLKAPINSGADDFGFILDTHSKLKDDQLQVGYFTSSRKGGAGLDDIYFFEKKVPVVLDDFIAKDSFDVEKVVITLNLITQEKEFEVPNDPNSPVKFRKPKGNVGVIIFENGELISETKTDQIGNLRMSLSLDKTYEFIGSASDYLSNKTTVSTLNLRETLQGDTILQARLLLEPIFYNKEIVLQDIYYDFDRWEIRDDAKPTLNELADLLSINPNLLIQLASHTDCRGSEEYNQELSQRRAQSVVNYLISKNISAERLRAKGFGESQPAINCSVCEDCTEEEHQINRRTTFAIIKE
jgi:peptidoglycan-associated lipoprotein